MTTISKYKVHPFLIVCVLVFMIVSLITIYSASSMVGVEVTLVFKQVLWYFIGLLVIFMVMVLGNNSILKYIWFLYFFFNFLLLLLLFFGPVINDCRCWFEIKGIGTFQPSEFMKVILILLISRLINEFNLKYSNPTVMEEFLFLIKILFIVLVPSCLTFLEPDTGVVLIYLLITFFMLFVAGIRYRWFVSIFIILLLFIFSVIGVYFFSKDLFIDIYGTSFFLRVDRLLDWSNKSGFQLKNGLNSIGGAGLTGYGILNTPLYFPEAQTDFIFAVFASSFGLLGCLFLISLITFFDIKLVIMALKSNSNTSKYIIAGSVGMLIYQQFQNIGMTFGLVPITGITLPFISYGGSSLLSYMFILGIIFNISNGCLKNTK